MLKVTSTFPGDYKELPYQVLVPGEPVLTALLLDMLPSLVDRYLFEAVQHDPGLMPKDIGDPPGEILRFAQEVSIGAPQ